MPAGWLNGEIAVVGLARSGRAVATLLASLFVYCLPGF
jgi:UDP-N-acetylmuramoylalanine-D-glutamate ligase